MKRFILVYAVALLALVGSGALQAGDQYHVPDEDAWAPVYARPIGDPDVGWVVTYLYRARECVPDDFNIWQFFDPTGEAFNCPFLMEGIVVYEEPRGFLPPRQSNLRNQKGVLVPVVFVTWEDWEALVADGVVTLPDLESAPSALLGWEEHHQDVLHPEGFPDGGGANVIKFNYKGRGLLEDGRSFNYHMSGQFRDGVENLRRFSVSFK